MSPSHQRRQVDRTDHQARTTHELPQVKQQNPQCGDATQASQRIGIRRQAGWWMGVIGWIIPVIRSPFHGLHRRPGGRKSAAMLDIAGPMLALLLSALFLYWPVPAACRHRSAGGVPPLFVGNFEAGGVICRAFGGGGGTFPACAPWWWTEPRSATTCVPPVIPSRPVRYCWPCTARGPAESASQEVRDAGPQLPCREIHRGAPVAWAAVAGSHTDYAVMQAVLADAAHYRHQPRAWLISAGEYADDGLVSAKPLRISAISPPMRSVPVRSWPTPARRPPTAPHCWPRPSAGFR